IRQWFSRERREDALESGRDMLTKAMRREALPVQKVLGGTVLGEVAEQLKYHSIDALYTAIGEHHVSPESVASRIAGLVRTAAGEREEVVSTPTRTMTRRRGRPAGVHVEGYDD